ncbi:hypothetical protein ZWY2020_032956 [Hordeum vulgare]|nr:hypothetical protein ZWY2020_032956 [Hordeum vulgare]
MQNAARPKMRNDVTQRACSAHAAAATPLPPATLAAAARTPPKTQPCAAPPPYPHPSLPALPSPWRAPPPPDLASGAAAARRPAPPLYRREWKIEGGRELTRGEWSPASFDGLWTEAGGWQEQGGRMAGAARFHARALLARVYFHEE